MPVSLWWDGQEVRASWGIDYFVAPDAEGLGYSIELVKAWMQSVDVAFVMGLAPTSYLICKRLGFRDLGHIPFFTAVLGPGRDRAPPVGTGHRRDGRASERRLTVSCVPDGGEGTTSRLSRPGKSAPTMTNCGSAPAVVLPRACAATPRTSAGDTARLRTGRMTCSRRAEPICCPGSSSLAKRTTAACGWAGSLTCSRGAWGRRGSRGAHRRRDATVCPGRGRPGTGVHTERAVGRSAQVPRIRAWRLALAIVRPAERRDGCAVRPPGRAGTLFVAIVSSNR